MSRTLLIVVQVSHVFSLFPWYFLLNLSYMIFDGGVTLARQTFFWSIAIYPLIMIAASIGAWISHRRDNSTRAVKFILIPYAYVLLFLLLLQIGLFG